MKLPTPSWQSKPFNKKQADSLLVELEKDQKIRSLTNEEQYWMEQYLQFLKNSS